MSHDASSHFWLDFLGASGADALTVHPDIVSSKLTLVAHRFRAALRSARLHEKPRAAAASC